MRTSAALNPRRGEIWLVQFNPRTGSEMGNPHPALVLSRDDVGTLPLRVVVPITSWQPRFATVPWMIEISPSGTNGLTNRSVADCFQPRSFDLSRFLTRWGQLDSITTERAAQTVAEVLGVALSRESDASQTA
jgi:mRNA interferase MazF